MVYSNGKDNPRYKTGLAGTLGIYSSWQNMKQRCLNPNHPKYHRYGGRGITICPEWLDIEGFADWAITSGFHEDMTIDRKDNDGNYCPENCIWITGNANARKKRTTKLTLQQAEEIRSRLQSGEKVRALAREFGVVHGTILFIKNRFTHVPDGECIAALNTRLATKHYGTT
jgi:hypothetical protein